MAMILFDRIFVQVDAALETYIIDTVSNVISFATPLFTSMLIVWIALWGYMMMYGRIEEPLREGVFRIIRIGGIMALGLTVGTYMTVVVNFLQAGPEHIAAVVSGTEGSTADMLDALFNKIFFVAKTAWEQGGIMNGNFGMYLIALLVIIVGCAMVLIIAFLVLLSKFMTTVLLGIGPLFIISLLFNVTKRFFESWISMLANFGFILILASSVGNLMLSMADSYITSVAPTPSAMEALTNLGDAIMLVIVFALCILVVRQVPMLAASLGGGFALATQGAVSSAMNALRPSAMQRGANSVRKDLQVTNSAATAPFRAASNVTRKTYAAYQKRFGGNTIKGN